MFIGFKKGGGANTEEITEEVAAPCTKYKKYFHVQLSFADIVETGGDGQTLINVSTLQRDCCGINGSKSGKTWQSVACRVNQVAGDAYRTLALMLNVTLGASSSMR